MKKEQIFKRPIVSFVLLTNLIFIPLFLLTGLTMLLGLPQVIFDIMLCIASWSSTFAFLILFKKIYPEQNLTEYIKNKFKNKVNLKVVSCVIVLQILIFIAVAVIVKYGHTIEGSLLKISSIGVVVYFFFKNLFAGPLGEELGWRGFVQEELQKKYSPLRAAIIVGFFWAIWHTPIWFTTGFWGIDLVKYILFFVISVIAISIVMAAFYNLNRNLIIPIIIHQLFNFFIGLINGNLLDLIGYCAILYGLLAVILIIINPKQVLYSKNKL